MGVKVKNPTSAQIEELRQKFNSKYASTPPAAPFHQVDLDRIRNEELWLQRFLEMHDLDLELAFKNLWDTCTWRQTNGINDLQESELNQQYLLEGAGFVHSQDVDGKPLLIFRVKLHNKNKSLDELIRIVIYWIERTQREHHLTQLTIFFDMAGCGLSNLDLDFVKRIVETFKLYYPNSLNYILVYELAWVLNAAFKVVKTLLPPKAVEILKMISKKDIAQYVPKANCLASWGGDDNYEFRFVPESKRAAAKPQAANAGDDDQPHQDSLDKKVHFAKSTPMVLNDSSIGEMHTPYDGEGMLQVEPSEVVVFCPQSGEAKLTLKNVSKQPMAYKIQTTSPEKFRVRPRCGVIKPAESSVVDIWLKQECQLSKDATDKFLVMAIPFGGDGCTSQELSELWKEKGTSDGDIEKHRLTCSSTPGGGKSATSKGSSASNVFGPEQMQERTAKLEAEHKFTRNLQYAMLFMLLLLFAGFAFLMNGQLHAGASQIPPTGFSCPKRK